MDGDEQAHFNAVAKSFRDYGSDMIQEIARRERNINRSQELVSLLPGGAALLATRMDQLKRACTANQFLFDQALKGDFFASPCNNDEHEDVYEQVRNLTKVRSSLHQLAREWSADGIEERKRSFQPLVDYLLKYVEVSPDKKVLVPGAGLGRLCLEIVGCGYSCQGNEFSYQMLVLSNLILNELNDRNSIEIFPWIHNPSNMKAFGDSVKSVQIPDKCACEYLKQGTRNGHQPELSMSAGEFLQVYKDQKEEWDSVVTCFFLDTAPNVLEYIKVIHSCLRPGGVWINGGPLLWHWQSNEPKSYQKSHDDKRYDESVELSYEEVKGIAENYGFLIKEEKWENCGYTSNADSMLRSTYEVVQFVAIKK